MRKVFRADQDNPFNAHLAQLCVLYEDLKIEAISMATPHMPGIDHEELSEASPGRILNKYRKHYFLRRSLVTIREFAECLSSLRKCPEFRQVGLRDEKWGALLDDAVAFFSANEQTFRTARNNSGGHFMLESAQYAVKHLDPKATSAIEIISTAPDQSCLKLHCAEEIIATAFTKGHPGPSSEEIIPRIMAKIPEAFKHASDVVQVMIGAVLYDRFG